MKYTSTIDLWDSQIQDRIVSGELKVQCGQWVKCGTNGTPARFVGLTKGKSIWVAHSEGKRGTSQSFKRLHEAFTGRASK